MRKLFLVILALCLSVAAYAQRSVEVLDEGWRFVRGDLDGAWEKDFDDSCWEEVCVPHDWAVCGPFDRANDLQNVAVYQNGETVATQKTGRTGGLPYIGVGWYRRDFTAGAGESVWLEFDGAMSGAEVFVNGQKVCEWPYGYNAFYCDIAPYVVDGRNVVAVRLENLPQSSRWYPGAGLYRNVRLVQTGRVHVPVWGVHVVTPEVGEKLSVVKVETEIEGLANGRNVSLRTSIVDSEGRIVSVAESALVSSVDVKEFEIENPRLWSPESPALYSVVTEVVCDGVVSDICTVPFGIRSVEFVRGEGFYLNGKLRKFKGVCNHHDLGPLGAAVNVSALRYRLALLKDMGCDAVRTSHNMPSPELVALCDEMGLMLMVEAFDEWDIAKCGNGYHRYFHEWAHKDMENMIRHFRNNPSVVMWSIGNEVPTQCSADGYRVAAYLQEICHRLDPYRPVTCGMDQVSCTLANGFAELLDVPGLNYRVFRYVEAFEDLPHKVVLGSETASTVSSRGVYKFPVVPGAHVMHGDNQSSSYDVEYCSWSNLPDMDFAMAEDYPWTMGQFVWTGFDYLGEPTPYDTDAWPSHSSLFGIIDLASIPKDRYYLYRSMWNKYEHTLHVLPHWTWPGREGEVTPVFVYTDYPWAELFVNGVSQGVRRRLTASESDSLKDSDPFYLQRRFRLIWDDVRYEEGKIEVVAYDSLMRAVDSVAVCTAGEPYAVELVPSRVSMCADGKDLLYIRVRIVDAEGNLCPHADSRVSFEVDGAGAFRAVANGDPTCTDMFHVPSMKAFGGEMTVIVQAGRKPGKIVVSALSEGLKGGEKTIRVRK